MLVNAIDRDRKKMYEEGLKEGKQEGLKEGEMKGERKGKRQITRALLARDTVVPDIAAIPRLSEEEIRKIT